MAKTRSPNYPAISLREAVGVVGQLYKIEKQTLVTNDVAAKAIGYKSLSGPARTKLSALKKYGLLEDFDNKVRISKLALKILNYPKESNEYVNAISEALIKPDIFAQFYDEYADSSDEAIKSHLKVEMNFSDEGVKNFISAFRDNLDFAKLNKISYTTISESEQENKDQTANEINIDKPLKKDVMSQNIEGTKQDVFSFQEGTAILQWPEKLSAESAMDFEAWLKLIIKKAKRSSGIPEEKS